VTGSRGGPPKGRGRDSGCSPARKGLDQPVGHIAEAAPRLLLRTTGRLVATAMRHRAAELVFTCTLDDGSGRITLLFLRPTPVAGMEPGSVLTVEGRILEEGGRWLILNPLYELQGRDEDHPEGPP